VSIIPGPSARPQEASSQRRWRAPQARVWTSAPYPDTVRKRD
jgi:hypothetical protein